MHTKIAFRADFMFSWAGCDAASSVASAARSTILSTNGILSAVLAKRSESFPVTTISAPRNRRSNALSSATWPNRFRSAAERIPSINRSAFSRHLSSPVRAAKRTRFCAATAFGLGIASSCVECGRSNRSDASPAERKYQPASDGSVCVSNAVCRAAHAQDRIGRQLPHKEQARRGSWRRNRMRGLEKAIGRRARNVPAGAPWSCYAR